MSEYTSNLQLFKYDTATDGKEVFSINDSMNDNWDKIDAFAAGIKSLSNLDAQGEKRFTDINTELNKKLEAEVLLAENGYIKFNNGVILQFGKCSLNPINATNAGKSTIVTLPKSFSHGFLCGYITFIRQGGGWANSEICINGYTLTNIDLFVFCHFTPDGAFSCYWLCIGY